MSVCSSPIRTASLTSSRSLANLLIANYFSSSIIFLYRFTVLSFSLTCLVYSIRTSLISFYYLSFPSVSSLISSSRVLISASCSLNNFLILSTSSLDRVSSSSPVEDPEDVDGSGSPSFLFALSTLSSSLSTVLVFLSSFAFSSGFSSFAALSGVFYSLVVAFLSVSTFVGASSFSPGASLSLFFSACSS